MKLANLWGVGFAMILVGGDVFAMAQKPAAPSAPGEVGYSRYSFIDDRREALVRSWKVSEDAKDKSYEEYVGTLKNYYSELDRAVQAQKDADAALKRQRDVLSREQISLTTLNQEINRLDQEALAHASSRPRVQKQIDELQGKKTQAQGRVDQAEAEVFSLNRGFEQAVAATERVKGVIQESAKRDKIDINLSAGVATSAAQVEGVMKRLKHQDAERITDQFFSQVSEDYLKSGMLATDFAVLKERYGIAGLKLELLKAKLEPKLNETLLGNYVQEQVKKAISRTCADSKFQAACAAGNVQGIQDILSGVFRPEAYVNEKQKPVAAPGSAVDAMPAAAPAAQGR